MGDQPKPFLGMTKDEKRLRIAIETRAFEIELFWKRSIFFWGFISVAFVGYATLRSASSDLAVIVACFGMVCSAAWTLLNRGSKYWQENWETKVGQNEKKVIGSLFGTQEKVQPKGVWLQARRYSVSKLLIALSDYVFLMWLGLFAWSEYQLARHFRWSSKDVAIELFCMGSLVYLGLLLWYGRTSPPEPADEGIEPG